MDGGYYHTVAVKTDGTLWAWGDNTYGQLGDGTTIDHSSPVQVGTATNWAAVGAGQYHTVAVKTDGTLWAWGDNTFGQLGDGTTTNHATPVQVGTATNWASAAGGYGHTVAVKTDGTVWGVGWRVRARLSERVPSGVLGRARARLGALRWCAGPDPLRQLEGGGDQGAQGPHTGRGGTVHRAAQPLRL